MSWTDQRPMSPHLQIYRLPITAITSILHRITGVLLYFGLILISAMLFAAFQGESGWNWLQSMVGSLPGQLLLIGMTFALYYHLVNGWRHMLWDIGYGFERERQSFYALVIFALSSLLTVITWLLVWLLS